MPREGAPLVSTGVTSTEVVSALPVRREGLPTSNFQGTVNQSRKQFYIDLKEGETSVVSWKKLVDDARKKAALTAVSETRACAMETRIAPERTDLVPTTIAAPREPLPAPKNGLSSVIERIEQMYKGVDSEEEDGGYASVDESRYDSDDSFIDDSELDEYFSISDTAKTKYTGFFVNRGKLQKLEESLPPPLPRGPSPLQVQGKRKCSSPKQHKRLRPIMNKKERKVPKRTALERAINDLEKGVIEAFSLTGDRQEAIANAEPTRKSRRLPIEVKQKLAKVARLAGKNGKIYHNVIERLMHIIGHVMPLKSLKGHLKSMVKMGLHAKQAKDARLQDMKRGVEELVKTRFATLQSELGSEQLEDSSDDVHATPGSTEGAANGRFKWDAATENRICDLYDCYLEGMDEPKGPRIIRKLYIDYLKDLWPEGWMDTHSIEAAVTRTKERKKTQNKPKIGEGKRSKKVAVAMDKLKAYREEMGLEMKAPTTRSKFDSKPKPILKMKK